MADQDPARALRELESGTDAHPFVQTLPAETKDALIEKAELSRQAPEPPHKVPNAIAFYPIDRTQRPDGDTQQIGSHAPISETVGAGTLTKADFNLPSALAGAPDSSPAQPELLVYPKEAAKAFATGAKHDFATALKGIEAARVALPLDEQHYALLDELKNGYSADLYRRAPILPQSLRGPFRQALHRIAEGVDPAHEQDELRALFAAYDKQTSTPIQERPLWRAGSALEHLGDEWLAPAPGFEPGQSWTGDIARGAGSTAARIGVSVVPGVGVPLAMATNMAAGMGDSAEHTVAAGATQQQIKDAAQYGSITGATDMVDTLLPYLGSTGRALGLIKRVGIAAIKGALLEGGKEGVKAFIENAIAKNIYDPDRDLTENVSRRALIGAIAGSLGGGGAAAVVRGAPTDPSMIILGNLFGKNKALLNSPKVQNLISKIVLGRFAAESIPARSPARDFIKAERFEINRIGFSTGCHMCGARTPGTKRNNFILDHQPASGINPPGNPQRIYPQCKTCNDKQWRAMLPLLRIIRRGYLK